MFSEVDGRITTRICSLPYYDSAARFGEQYKPTAKQREALVRDGIELRFGRRRHPQFPPGSVCCDGRTIV